MAKLLPLTNDYVLTQSMEIYIIELPKVEKYGLLKQYKNLNLWVKYIREIHYG